VNAIVIHVQSQWIVYQRLTDYVPMLINLFMLKEAAKQLQMLELLLIPVCSPCSWSNSRLSLVKFSRSALTGHKYLECNASLSNLPNAHRPNLFLNLNVIKCYEIFTQRLYCTCNKGFRARISRAFPNSVPFSPFSKT